MTGYTSELVDKNLDFPAWAMVCARAFGALVTMRDKGMDAPIPTEFIPSGHHRELLQEARAERVAFLALSDEERNALAFRDKQAQVERAQAYMLRCEQENAILDAMAEKVRAWRPPTVDHQGLKDFMLQQIETSRNDTLYAAARLEEAKEINLGAWIVAHEEHLNRVVEMAQRNLTDEVERCADRTAWVQALRGSLDVTA